jgi:hypothetical protein
LCLYDSDFIMKRFLSPQWRSQWLAIAFGLGCAPPLLAQTLPFSGRWLLDDHPETQAYTILTIKGTSITWRGPNKSTPPCVQEFALKKENPGTVYADVHGTKFVAGALGSLPTYLLTISASTCGGIGEQVRIRYPLVYDVTHIEFIEYAQGKPVSSRRFHRKQ